MREIKFRGRTTDGIGWAFGGIKKYIDHPGVYAIIEEVEAGSIYRVDPKTIGQYTGLKDKNGKEIWEGDLISVERQSDTIIVECKFGTIERQMATGFLCDITGFYFEREDGCQTFPIKKNYKDAHDLQVFSVVGNVHDNPELIGQIASVELNPYDDEPGV